MNISRISKAIAEVRGDKKFQDAEDVRNVDIDIFLPEKICESVCQMLQTATALALRCFKGKIRVHFGDSSSAVRQCIYHEAAKMAAEYRVDLAPREVGPVRLALACHADGAISADASGWTARINGVFRTRIPAASPASAFAVACAFAKLFNRAIFRVERHTLEAWDFCLLRFAAGEVSPESVRDNLALGKIGLLGAGAIGSALGYVLQLSSWSAELHLIDFDFFEEPNLETCVSADWESVKRPLSKAKGLTKPFSGHAITAIERNCKVTVGHSILAERWDVFSCAVDNGETRRILDDVNAGLLVNAGLGGTTRDAGWVLWTKHGKNDPKLSSIYQAAGGIDTNASEGEDPEEFQDECSRKSYRGVSLALPFVAVAAGSLLGSDMYRQAIGYDLEVSFLQIDLFAKQQRFTLLPKQTYFE